MAKRNRAGQGTIFKRGKSWVGSVYLGKDANGKRIRVWRSGKTQKEVQTKLAELKSQGEQGYKPDFSKPTVEETVNRYLTLSKNGLEQNTWDGYRRYAEAWVIPHLGKIALNDLTVHHVDDLISKMEAQKKSARTQVHAVGVLSRASKMAIKKKTLMHNVCDAASTPTVHQSSQPTLTEPQLKTLFQALENERLKALFVIFAQTGMRVSEVLGLKKDAVDLQSGEIFVKRALVDSNGVYYTKERLKTKKSNRRIQLTALAESALIDHLARMEAEGNGRTDWIFCNADGDHLKRRAVLQWFKRILKNAGLPVMPLKNLRHTAATILLGRKWSLKTAADLLGHSNIATTAMFYAQTTVGIHSEAMADLNDAMTPTGPSSCAVVAPEEKPGEVQKSQSSQVLQQSQIGADRNRTCTSEETGS